MTVYVALLKRVRGVNYFIAVCIPSDAGETCTKTKNGTCVEKEVKIEDCKRYLASNIYSRNYFHHFNQGNCLIQNVKRRRLNVREIRDPRP